MLDLVSDLADRFGAIEGIRSTLLSQPDRAATKLADVLGELAQTVAALDDEMVRYLSLHFHSEESIARGRGVLLGMEVGQSAIRINEARGHCHKIKNTYDAYLDKWFDRAFGNSAERKSLRTIFDGLTTADDFMVDAMKQTSAWLKAKAGQTLDAVDADNLVAANSCIRDARREAKPAREKLAEAMSMLGGLQADFIYASGTV